MAIAATPVPFDPLLLQNQPADRVFMHIEYGRNHLPRKVVRSIFDLTCKEMCAKIGIDNFTIAYSRPKNMAPGKEASKYYMGELSAERER